MLDTTRSPHTRALANTRVFYRPWFPDPRVAQILIDYRATIAGPPQLSQAVELLRSLGFHGAVTGAIMPNEQPQFEQLGFVVRENLHVLSRPVNGFSPSKNVHPRRMRTRDVKSLLRIDHQSFSRDWQLDEQGLADAKHATSHSRVRVVEVEQEVVAYAITGRTGRNGYLQRLAVDSSSRHLGVASALVADSLRWLSRRRVENVSVNTQLDNQAAIGLYERLGFKFEDYKLAILHCSWD